ncbi:hypothetical protein HYT52_02075 [Candidatus Woesearchaeota archaeon]|nr:hypothetical protein [Candidatus Woesearchaeota archaeon]
MVNSWYEGKEEAILQVLAKEGIVTLFDFLCPDEFAVLRKKTFSFRKKNDVLRGKYAEALAYFDDDFLRRIVQGKMEWNALQLSSKDYIVRNDHTALKKGIYALYQSQHWDDSYGGYVVFIDEEGNHIRVPSQKNTLTIIKNPVSFYVKYVNHLARGKREFLFGMMGLHL